MSAIIPLLVIGLATAPASGAPTRISCIIKRQAFDRLKTGMSLETVVAVLGCDGEIANSEDVGDVRTETYSWMGDDGGYASAFFKNGALAYKRQRGLR